MNKHPKVLRGVNVKELSQKIKCSLFIINLKIKNMLEKSIFTKNNNRYYLARLSKVNTVTKTWTHLFRVRVRTCAKGKQPETHRQTLGEIIRVCMCGTMIRPMGGSKHELKKNCLEKYLLDKVIHSG